MIIPVRCFSCGKVTGNLWDKYCRLLETMSEVEAFAVLGLTRMCCQKILSTHVPLLDKALMFDRINEKTMPSGTIQNVGVPPPNFVFNNRTERGGR